MRSSALWNRQPPNVAWSMQQVVGVSLFIALALLASNNALAQFDRDVRRFYREAIRSQMVPKIRSTETDLQYELPMLSGYNAANATPLEVAGVEQARVEAIKMYRMNTARRRANWNTVLPSVESEIQEIIRIDQQSAGGQLTEEERARILQVTERIDRLYEDFFSRLARQSDRDVVKTYAVRAYAVSVYSKPAGAHAEECDRGTYLLHRHLERPIPWKTVRLGQYGHYTYGRVILRARWPDDTGFSDRDWTHVRGRVVELDRFGPHDAGLDESYPHPP